MEQDPGIVAQVQAAAPSFAESAIMAAYTESIKGALAAADSAASAVGAAAFSLGAGYGALVGLVGSKTAPTAFVLSLPFVGFAGSAVISTWAKFFGTEIKSENGIAQIEHMLRRAILWKRTLGGISLAALVATMVGTGILVTLVWGPGH